MLLAEPMGKGHVPTTPKLPNSPYVVHDGTRPQPAKVTPQGAVHVKAPSDASVLFGGTDSNAWTSMKGGPAWEVKDGVLVASKIGDIKTKQEFSDFQLHLEWRIPAGRKVNGQGGGNSGVFLPGGHEIQILESHANESYPDGEAGALYGQTPPLVNATLPQGEWQSYDIIFTSAKTTPDGKLLEPAKVTVIHNGVVLHHNKAFLGPTRYRQVANYNGKIAIKGPIRLQFHGDPVEYQNIWIRETGDYDSGEPVPAIK